MAIKIYRPQPLTFKGRPPQKEIYAKRKARYNVYYTVFPAKKKVTKTVTSYADALWIKNQLENKLPATEIKRRRVYIKKA